MIIFPAIDIKNGKVVRLTQGKFDQVTEYSDDPVAVAKEWAVSGAQWLHVVDLDGAETGSLVKNLDCIKRIATSVKIKIQLGGGIRTLAMVSLLLDKTKIDRIILGTSVVTGTNDDFSKPFDPTDSKDKRTFKKIIADYGEKIAVSIDCKNGLIARRGWKETTEIKGVDLAKRLEACGLKRIIYTDIARDGMLTGPNWEGLKEILTSVKTHVIASGGLASIEDIKKLIDLKETYKNLEGAITGRAIYEGKLNLAEAIKLCSPKG